MICQRLCQRLCQRQCQRQCQRLCQRLCQRQCQRQCQKITTHKQYFILSKKNIYSRHSINPIPLRHYSFVSNLSVSFSNTYFKQYFILDKISKIDKYKKYVNNADCVYKICHDRYFIILSKITGFKTPNTNEQVLYENLIASANKNVNFIKTNEVCILYILDIHNNFDEIDIIEDNGMTYTVGNTITSLQEAPKYIQCFIQN
jgi:hypothetical protein